MGETMKRLILALALGWMAGCHSGDFVRVNGTETMLQSNNYRVVMTGVRGQDAGFKVFGIGGSAQYSTCLEKIRVLAELEGRSRALVNVTQDENWWNVGIVSGETLTVTCDVVEFTGPPNGTQ